MSTFPVVSIVHLVTANAEARDIVSEGFKSLQLHARCPPQPGLLISIASGPEQSA